MHVFFLYYETDPYKLVPPQFCLLVYHYNSPQEDRTKNAVSSHSATMVGFVSNFLLVYYIEISAINFGDLPYASATGPSRPAHPASSKLIWVKHAKGLYEAA